MKDPQDILFDHKPQDGKKKQVLDTEGGSFIFLVDRSGSMYSGQRIPLTKEAMSLFMQSLPVGSRFQIVSYGSQHKYFSGNKELVPYTQENMQKALEYITTI